MLRIMLIMKIKRMIKNATNDNINNDNGIHGSRRQNKNGNKDQNNDQINGEDRNEDNALLML